jgi:PmbA protein
MRKALNQAASAGADATLTFQESRKVELSFEFNRLKGIQNTESLSLTAQAIKDGRLGVAFSTKAGEEADLLQRAIRLSEYGAPAPYSFPAPAPSTKPAVYSEGVASLRLEEMLEVGEDLSGFLRTLHPDVNGSVTVAKVTSREGIANTKGLEASWDKTILSVTAAAELVEGQNMVHLWDFQVGTDLQWEVERMKREIQARFDLARKNVKIETGAYPVLFTPMAFRDLLSPILACLNGKAVTRGISPLAGRLGEQVFSADLTVVEDGLMAGGLGSRMYDDQGVACRRTSLIEKGVLREYLLDLETAHKLGREPIGTGGVATVAPANLIVEGGSRSKDDLLSGVKQGIIIEATMGAWAGNPYSGQVSGNIAMGFLIEDGKLTGRVKDCMFSLNVFSHLKDHLVALSRETKNIGIALPYALVENVSVTAKSS